MTEDTFLTDFFGPGNEISWGSADVREETHPERLSEWVDRYRSGHWPAPLPRVRRIQGRYQTTWYIIEEDRDRAVLVSGELQGFLGRSYTDLDPLAHRFDSNDAIERLVQKRYPHAVKVTITTSTNRDYAKRAEMVRKRLRLWLSVRDRRPEGSRTEEELLAELLYRFEDALRLGRLELAQDNLQKIEVSGKLHAHNLKGLEVLYLERTESWRTIWDDPGFDRLVEVGPPRRVAQAMLGAAYRSEVQPHEERLDAQGALSVYNERLATRCGPLLGTSRGFDGPEPHTIMLLRGLNSRTPSSPRIEEAAAAAIKAGANPDWIFRLRALVPTGAAGEPNLYGTDVFSLIGREFGRNNLDLAWQLASEAEASVERAIWMMRIALEVESIRWAHEALNDLRGIDLGEEEKGITEVAEALRRRVQARFSSKSAQGVPDELPGGWLEWAARLGGQEHFVDGVKLAEEGRIDWDMAPASDPDWTQFSRALERVSDVNTPVLRRSIPHVLSAIGSTPSDATGLDRLYTVLLEVILLDDAPGDTFFPSIEDLLERLLSQGVSRQQYSDLLTDVADGVTTHVAPSNIELALDIVDLLFDRPCADHDARLRLTTMVLNEARAHLPLLSTPSVVMLRLFARLTGWKDGVFDERFDELTAREEAGVAPSVEGSMNGKSIALYSLDEGSLGRAAEAILSMAPGADVRTYSSKVATEPLLTAAAQADLFVVAHRVAKHAATDAIRSARQDGALRYAQGKGSSSLVRAVWQWAEETVHSSALT